VVLAKPGLDGHDRGVKVVAMALRDAGAEVIYLGMRRTSDQIVDVALQEDADAIGLSILSGSHLALIGELLAARREKQAEDIPVVVGGTISSKDAAAMEEMGVAAVFPVGTPIDDVVAGVLAAARRRDA
jgi:methylmalonyl-CoA mutase C-terminal domain/subunit